MNQVNSTLDIKHIPVSHCSRLHRLFTTALDSDFDYFSDTYKKSVLATNTSNKLRLAALHRKRILLGAYANDQLIGYSISSISRNNIAFLFWLFVSPEHRGKQIGRHLLYSTENNLQKRRVDSIELITHNQQRFYEKNGFELQKMLQGLVAGVDMYAMQKRLQ